MKALGHNAAVNSVGLTFAGTYPSRCVASPVVHPLAPCPWGRSSSFERTRLRHCWLPYQEPPMEVTPGSATTGRVAACALPFNVWVGGRLFARLIVRAGGPVLRFHGVNRGVALRGQMNRIPVVPAFPVKVIPWSRLLGPPFDAVSVSYSVRIVRCQRSQVRPAGPLEVRLASLPRRAPFVCSSRFFCPQHTAISTRAKVYFHGR